MKSIQELLGKSIYNPSDKKNYIISSFKGDKVTIVDFKTKKVKTLQVIEIDGLEDIDENTYAGFSEDWNNGLEFENID